MTDHQNIDELAYQRASNKESEMPKTDYLTKPYGDRPTEPVARDAWDWLMEHGGDGGADAVKHLADFIQQPRCPECLETKCCYDCASQGGPGADLLPRDAGPTPD